MTVRRVWSGGSNTSPYDTWAKAATAFATADAASSPGDTILVHYTHDETDTACFDYTDNSRLKDPVFVVSVDKDNSDAFTAGGKIGNPSGGTTVGTSSDTGYCLRGMHIKSDGDISMQSDTVFNCTECRFVMTGGGTNNEVITNDMMKQFLDCEFEPVTAGPQYWPNQANMIHDNNQGWKMIAPTSGTQIHFVDRLESGHSYWDGVDVSAMGGTNEFYTQITNALQGPTYCRLANSKCATGMHWPTNANIVEIGSQWEMYNCVVGTTTYYVWREQYAGTITDDTSEYLSADIDGTSMSYKYVTRATGMNFGTPLGMMICEFYADANPTIKVNFTSSVALDAGEAWIWLQYPDSTDPEYGKFYRSRDWSGIIDGTGSSGALSTNTETWNVSTSNRYHIEHTVTGGGAGVHRLWFYVALETSGTARNIWVDPKPVIT